MNYSSNKATKTVQVDVPAGEGLSSTIYFNRDYWNYLNTATNAIICSYIVPPAYNLEFPLYPYLLWAILERTTNPYTQMLKLRVHALKKNT